MSTETETARHNDLALDDPGRMFPGEMLVDGIIPYGAAPEWVVAIESLDSQQPSPALTERQGEVLFWFGYQLEVLQKLGRQDLIAELTSSHPQIDDEALPQPSVAGSVLPRLLTFYSSITDETQGKSLQQALEIFDFVVSLTDDERIEDETDLAVTYAEHLARCAFDNGHREYIKGLLQILLGTRDLEEKNLPPTHSRLYARLQQKAIFLHSYYSYMPKSR